MFPLSLPTSHSPTPTLLSPLAIGSVTLRNRAIFSPMCMYAVEAEDGTPTDWHLAHLVSRATGGFGMVVAEATAVRPEGRISPRDLGLWNRAQREAFTRIMDGIRAQGGVPAIQLAHAGAKASTFPEWPGYPSGSVRINHGGWQTLSPSGINPVSGLADSQAMDENDIQEVIAAFADSARTADQAGAEAVLIHAAHGYLLHQFLSPVTNQRTDHWGGDFSHRTRLLREVVAAVRKVWPENKILGLRISGSDYVEGSWSIDDSARLISHIQADPHRYGLDWLDVSSGGIGDTYPGPRGPGYQVPLAERLTQETASSGMTHPLTVSAVGQIANGPQAEQILCQGQAHAVSIGRAGLANSNWPVEAAAELGLPGEALPFPPQYARALWGVKHTGTA